MKNIHCAELDAYYARLYGLTRDEVRYTLRVDPKEVHGEDFPGETVRVLKEKEVKQFLGSIGRLATIIDPAEIRWLLPNIWALVQGKFLIIFATPSFK